MSQATVNTPVTAEFFTLLQRVTQQLCPFCSSW